MKALALVNALVVSEASHYVVLREDSHRSGEQFASEGPKRREIAFRGKMSRDAIRPTPKAWRARQSPCPALDVLRLCSSAPKSIF
jgi:hypothetical protein